MKKTTVPETERKQREIKKVVGGAFPTKLMLLLAGKSGAGKTRLASTFPKPLILDFDHNLEGSLEPGKSYDVAEFFMGEKIYVPVLNYIRDLKRGNPPFDVDPPETLIVDSMSFMAHYMEPEVAGALEMEIQHYNLHKNRVVTILNMLRELPQHVVVTTGVTPQKDEISGSVEEHPSMTGQKEGPFLPHCFTWVFLMKCEKAKDPSERELAKKAGADGYVWSAYTKPFKLFEQVKSKFGLPNRIVNPTYTKLMKLAKEFQEDSNA